MRIIRRLAEYHVIRRNLQKRDSQSPLAIMLEELRTEIYRDCLNVEHLYFADKPIKAQKAPWFPDIVCRLDPLSGLVIKAQTDGTETRLGSAHIFTHDSDFQEIHPNAVPLLEADILQHPLWIPQDKPPRSSHPRPTDLMEGGIPQAEFKHVYENPVGHLMARLVGNLDDSLQVRWL